MDPSKQLVEQLGRAIGFGNMMQLTQECWTEANKKDGVPEESAKVCGPCLAETVPCDHNGFQGHECDWCGGCGWVTKKVAKSMKVEKIIEEYKGAKRDRHGVVDAIIEILT